MAVSQLWTGARGIRVTLLGLLIAAAASAASPPNIVFIMSDDMGIGELQTYRVKPFPQDRVITTPNIARLFESGMRMNNAYTGEAVCSPSRAAFLLGKHTGHSFSRGNHGFDGHDLPIPANETAFPALLKTVGYHTAFVGKYGLGWWNNSGAPWEAHIGFDTYYGQLDQAGCHNMYPYGNTNDDALAVWQYAGSGNAIPMLFPGNANASREFCMSPAGIETCVWTHDLWTNKSLDVLTAQAAAGVGAPPLFLLVAYTDPHAGGWGAEAESGAPVPTDGAYAGRSWPNIEIDHASQISTYQDRDIGRILDLIMSSPSLAENTLIMFSSDNGAHNEGGHDVEFFDSNGPYTGFKRSLYEGGIHTPFAAVWPGHIQPNTTSDAVMAFWDILPTLADIVGIPSSSLPSGLDGVSMLPAWTGGVQPVPADKPLYWEFCTCLGHDGLPCNDNNNKNVTAAAWQHAIRVRDTAVGWKALALEYSAEWKLFNLTDDPYESKDLAQDFPDVVKQLAALAKAQHEDNPIFPVNPCTPS